MRPADCNRSFFVLDYSFIQLLNSSCLFGLQPVVFQNFTCFFKYLTLLRVEAICEKKLSQTAGISSSRDSFSEIVHNDNRTFVLKCGPIQPSLNFPQTQQGQRKYRFQKNGTKNSTGWNIWRFRTIDPSFLQ